EVALEHFRRVAQKRPQHVESLFVGCRYEPVHLREVTQAFRMVRVLPVLLHYDEIPSVVPPTPQGGAANGFLRGKYLFRPLVVIVRFLIVVLLFPGHYRPSWSSDVTYPRCSDFRGPLWSTQGR